MNEGGPRGVVSVVILTFNCKETVGPTLEAALQVSHDVHVVDSYSTDGTPEHIQQCFPDITVHQRAFASYDDQRNWAISNLPLTGRWQLHLDADERLPPELIAELRQAVERNDVEGFHIPRLVRFLGREIRHGGMYPIYHLRLFRTGTGRCENRRYDQHFVVDGRTARLKAPMIDDMQQPLAEWTARHNRWSDAEVAELRSPSASALHPGLRGTPQQRRRWLRGRYERLPLLVRPWLLFFYRYVLRMGFRDGREGLVFFTLQTLWFRFLVDAKVWEQELQREVDKGDHPDC